MTTRSHLPSNGFGRIEQQIVLSIPVGEEDNLSSDLDLTPLETTTSPPRVSYLWRRWTTRLGDDEDVVVELSASFGTSKAEIDWQIDWDASSY